MKRSNDAYRKKIKRLTDSKISNLLNLRSRLNEDQIAALARSSTRGLKWSPKTVRDGLVFKMKMGSKAFGELLKKVPIYPSVRTLQRSVEHMDFNSGVLYDVLEAVKEDVARMSEEDRVCVIGGDEMAIQEGEAYDPGDKKMIGNATFGPHSGLAKKALALVIGGVSKRYKFTGAYVFTSSAEKKRKKSDEENAVGEAMKALVLELVAAAESVGLQSEAYISDMGPDNQAMWRAFNIGCSGEGRIARCSIPHPCRPGARFWFLPDTVHLYKNIVTSLSSNKIIILSNTVVEDEKLRCNEVKLEHLQGLLDFEKKFELKVAYHLKQDNLDCKKTFAKMRVSNPAAVFCKRTEAGLRAKAELEETAAYDATIFFIALVTHWFALVTNRAIKLALDPSKPEEYQKATAFIRKVADVFRSMQVGRVKQWKPIQTGVIMACEALLEIAEDLLVNRKLFKFLLLGRFTQDFVENLFSLIRYRLAVPNALHFKHNLRVVTLAQICLAATNTSYHRDTEEDVVVSSDFLAATRKSAEARKESRAFNVLVEEAVLEVPQVADEDLLQIDRYEWMVIYTMAGSTLRSIKNMKSYSTCDTCFDALLWADEERSHPCAGILELLEYKQGVLYAVSDHCFKATLKAEVVFRGMRDTLREAQHIDVVEFLVDSLMAYAWDGADIPTCHNITRKFLRRYLTMRFQTYGLLRRQVIKEASKKVYASKTMAMHTSVA